MRKKGAKKKPTRVSVKGKAVAKPKPAPLPSSEDAPERDPLDELLADDAGEDDGDLLDLRPGESPDQLLQRECMRTLQEPGLKPHDRLKVIQTLDKVNGRLSQNATKEDIGASLRAWICETLGDGPGPMADC